MILYSMFSPDISSFSRFSSFSFTTPNRAPAPPVMPTGIEPEEVDVSQFYVQTDALEPCASPKAEAAAILDQLDSATWTVACTALVSARRLAKHHPDELAGALLEAALPRLRTHINSLRSSLCKTALICAADFFIAYGEDMLEHLGAGTPSLLGSLLHKAALDKRFVMDEAKRTLDAMVNVISGDVLLHLLLLHVSETNPKVRAVVAKCVVDAVSKALRERQPGAKCCVDVERAELLKAANIFVNDRQPFARECARKLVAQLRETYVVIEVEGGDGGSSGLDWAQFVEKTLGKSVALKICKI